MTLLTQLAVLLVVAVAALVLLRRVQRADQRILTLMAQQREQAKELHRRINCDSLTNLANRSAFVTALEEHLRELPDQTAVMFIDLDDFKTMNDTLGHAVGDELIVAVGQRLVHGIRGGDLVARFGGDEFAVLISAVGASDVIGPAERLLAELKAPFVIGGRTLIVHASAGVAVSEASLSSDISQRAQDLLKHADLAMYESKTRHTRSVTMFHAGMQTDLLERLSLESDMHRALVEEQFFLDYQPIIDLATGELRIVEALLRWRHPSRGLISPVEFIPIAEQSGQIVGLTLWVVARAVEQLVEWDIDPTTKGMCVAINVSARLVVEPGIGASIARELAHAGIDPQRIVLEITESLLMEDRAAAILTLCELREIGMRLSVDDFGTGYSSLSRLNTLPIDEVKIDRSFIERLDTDGGRTIVTATIAMAHGLGLRVVAEGVEEHSQNELLVAAGCDDAQGYLYSRPVAPDLVTAYLNDLPRQRAEHSVAVRSR